MNIIVLTSLRAGIASKVVPTLAKNLNIKNLSVVLVAKNSSLTNKRIKRILKKIGKIGILGALNGIRIRKWFFVKNIDNIDRICNEQNITFYNTDYLNSKNTIEIFKSLNPDLGISLGNSYISSKVFTIPKLGMVNIHCELLPEFQGAQSIIWPIHESIKQTGFTIHRINKKIDGGNILYRYKQPIVFYKTLRETVEQNLDEVYSKIPEAFDNLITNFVELDKTSVSQTVENSFTTPSFWQFMRMVKNNKMFFKNQKTLI